ncbi:hypothetical protein [Phycisphaera mikurensis]|uniref:Uncharacterized protein n=1 Tax=Phycisphaera mikurensis (strain NBRC 102666 / KCTC 22515 / FYK2301M01) TaxID=1142394 RepID=I0IAC4_PHYMF|nr:hypothetical protein [Phycisphaera mikurensis]MBB6441789.1 hypothetical protein [Phycisphaera mikurensis]BAM02212.1 hypothetical protein PSMK_00530 [Phycisphaera mikurensis NBRC 102666]
MSLPTAPFAATALAAALLAATGCDQPEGPAAVDTAVTAPDAHDHADGTAHETAAEDVMDDADAAGDSLMEDAGAAMDGVREDAEGAMGDAAAKGEELLAAGTSTMEKVGEGVNDLSAQMQTKVAELMNEAGNAIGEGNLDKAQAAVDKLKEMDLSSVPSMEEAVEGLQSTITQMRG